MNEREHLYRKTAVFPLFLRVWCIILFTLLMFLRDLFGKLLIYCVGYPLAIAGLIVYFIIIKPIKWILGLFIKIEKVDIYE
jgi:hypothetical protein